MKSIQFPLHVLYIKCIILYFCSLYFKHFCLPNFFWGGEVSPVAHGNPRLGVKLELQLLAYVTTIAMPRSKLFLRPTQQLTATPDP